jgi:hypothetical protein
LWRTVSSIKALQKYDFKGETMRRLRVPLVVLIAFLSMSLLSGCIKMRTHITFNRNGSADVEFVLAANKLAMEMGKENTKGQDPLIELRRNFESEGFTVTDYVEGELKGIQAVKHVKDNKEIVDAFSAFSKNAASTGSTKDTMFSPLASGLEVKKSFFSTQYKLNCTLEPVLPETEKGKSGNEFDQLGAQMAKSMIDFSFAVTLPVKPKTSNAPKVSDAGRTLEWPINLDSTTPMNMELVVPNIKNFAIAAVGLVLVIIILVTLSCRKRPSPKPVEEKESSQEKTPEKSE